MSVKACKSCKHGTHGTKADSDQPTNVDIEQVNFSDNIKLSISGSFQSKLYQFEPFELFKIPLNIVKTGKNVQINGVFEKYGNQTFFGTISKNEIGDVCILASNKLFGNSRIVLDSSTDNKNLLDVITDYESNGDVFDNKFPQFENCVAVTCSCTSNPNCCL